MGPLLAWLPFLASLVVAFAAGVAFARINEGLIRTAPAVAAEPQPPEGRGHRLSRLYRADMVLTAALVGLLVGVLLVWLVALVTLIRRGS